MNQAYSTERYRVVAAEATTIPDWVLLNNKISTAARLLAGIILLHHKNGDPPPTCEQLADDLKVNTRSISCWLNELREEKIVITERTNRRNVYSFLKQRVKSTHDRYSFLKQRVKSTHDRMIPDREISDHSVYEKKIVDHSVYENNVVCPTCSALGSGADARTTQNFIVRSGGGGGSSSYLDLDPTPTTGAAAPPKIVPDDITTETGRACGSMVNGSSSRKSAR